MRAEDEIRDALGEPPRFAIAQPVWITPESDGTWEEPRSGGQQAESPRLRQQYTSIDRHPMLFEFLLIAP